MQVKHNIGDVWINEQGMKVFMNGNKKIERYWSPQDTKRFIELYPRTTNEDLCFEFDVTVSAIKRKAYRLGLKKDYRYFYEIHKDVLFLKKKMSTNRGRNGRIKDYLSNETEEQKRQRLEKSATTRRNAPLHKKLQQKKRLQETYESKTEEEKASKAKKISDSWKDPIVRERRIAKLKETLAKKSKAERMITAHLISVSKKARFAQETEDEKRIRCEKIRLSKKKCYEECSRAV